VNSQKSTNDDQMSPVSLMRREVLAPATVAAVEITVSPAGVYLASLAEGSRKAMLGALALVAESISGARDVHTFDWSSLRYEHLAAIRGQLAGQHSPAYANKILSAVKGAMKAAWRLGLMSSDDFQRMSGP
jgi:hypothetical protein